MTPKQARFVSEYLKDHNATQAAIRAGYSSKTAGSQAHDLLKNPEISRALSGSAEKVERKNIAEAQEVLEFYTRIMRDEGQETIARLKATDSLAKFHKLLTDKVEHSGDVTIAVVDPYAEGEDDQA